MCCCGLIGGCLGACCSGCCCNNLKECNVKHGAASRIPYIFIIFIFSIFAVFMSLYGEDVLYRNHLLHIRLSVCESQSCQGNGSVYRTSFALFVFFMIQTIVVFFIASFHWNFFGWKMIFLIGFLVATFWIPDSVFDGYAEFARIASAIFLLLQVIVLISWAWDVNDRIVVKINELQEEKACVNEAEQEKDLNRKIKLYQFLLVLITLIVVAAIIILCLFMFRWFDKNSSCSFGRTILIITIVLIFISICLPPLIQTGSIFTASVVGFYMAYLCYTGLSSYPRKQCNPFADKRDTASLWIGIIITAAAIAYVGFSTSKHEVLFPNDDMNPNKHTKINNTDDDIELQVPKNKKQKNDNDNDIDDNDDDTQDLNDCNGNDNDVEKKGSDVVTDQSEASKAKIEQRANVLFHLCMAFAAIYMCMLYTNWGTNVVSKTQANSRGRVSLWVNIASLWATFILYVWTLVAPRICPQRFGIEKN